MMLGPAERLVKRSSLQAWGEGRMVSVSPGSKFASHPNMAPRSRTRSGMTLDGSITDTGLSDAARVCGNSVRPRSAGRGDRGLDQHVDEMNGKREMARTHGPDQWILSGAAGNRTRLSTRSFRF